MNQTRMIAWAGGLIIAFVVLANTFYIVDQRKQAVVLRFGDPVRVVNAFRDNDPGLKMKAPFLENVILLDKRNQPLEADKEEVIAADQQRLVVDAFLRYRISDPLQFYRTLRDERTAADRLDRLVNSSLREVLGRVNSNDIVSGRRDQLMLSTRNDVAARARESRLGIDVIDVRVKRVDLPQSVEQFVFRRMQTSRQQEAAQKRALGEQQKREIIAGADKEVAITLATATEEGETTRGEGDSKRTAIFAQAYGTDPSFASFYRSMQAYDSALGQGDTTLVLSPNSEFFRYFENGPGK